MINMPVKTVTETFHLSSYDSANSITVGEVLDAETGPIGTSIVGYDYDAMYNEGKYSSIFRDSVHNAKNGLQSEWNIFYNFDLSNIPEDAIIKSVSCDVLGYYSVGGEKDSQDIQKEIVSPIPRVTTLQLYNGIGKPKGNIRENCYLIDILTNLDDSAAIEKKYKKIFSLDCGEWTREELKDCKLNMHVIRGADQNYIIDGVDHSGFAFSNFCQMMAADLTVEYEIQVQVNKVVFSGDTLIDLTGDTVCPEMLAEGITAHDMSGKKITGTMSTKTYTTKNLFTGSEEPSKYLGKDGDLYLKLPKVISKTFPLAVFNSNDSRYYIENYPEKPLNYAIDTPNYYYTYFQDRESNVGKNSSEWCIFYKFDLSTLPEDAIIINVMCRTKSYYGWKTDEYKPKIAQIQLYNGANTAKGEQLDLLMLNDNSASIKVFNGGKWTREELNDCRFRFYAVRDMETPYYYNSCPNIYPTEIIVEYISPSKKERVSTTLESFDSVNSTYTAPKFTSSDLTKNCFGKIYMQEYYYYNYPSCFEVYNCESTSSDYIAEHIIMYKFKPPIIPDNAIITSVSCILNSYWTNGKSENDQISETVPLITRAQLYSGTDSPKGDYVDNRGDKGKILTINGGEWSKEELNNCVLRFYASIEGNIPYNPARVYLWIFGASLVVEYKFPGSESSSSSSIKVKTEGKWEDQVALETLENLLPNDTAYAKQ